MKKMGKRRRKWQREDEDYKDFLNQSPGTWEHGRELAKKR